MKFAPLACALDAALLPVCPANAAGNDDLPVSLVPCQRRMHRAASAGGQPGQAGSRP